MDQRKITVPRRTDITFKTDLTDTYVTPGEKKKSLVIAEKKRNSFFQTHTRVETLLRRELYNPLLEEGSYQVSKRDHKGEYYLTADAIKLALHMLRDQYKTNPNFNFNNTYFVGRNDENFLEDVLLNLNLRHGEDAKFIIMLPGMVHAIAVYVRREEKIKIFIADSEPGKLPDAVVRQVGIFFGDFFMVASSARLQYDYYSCGTFALDATLYFARYGAEVFPHIQRFIPDTSGLHKLAASHLMPRLLKMCQSPLESEIEKDALDSIVVAKSRKTLRQYWEENKEMIDGRSYNKAALRRKYTYFHRLELFLQSHSEMKLGEEKKIYFHLSESS